MEFLFFYLRVEWDDVCEVGFSKYMIIIILLIIIVNMEYLLCVFGIVLRVFI